MGLGAPVRMQTLLPTLCVPVQSPRGRTVPGRTPPVVPWHLESSFSKPPPSPQIIGNCVSLLVLSSALPVFSRTLGELPEGSG